MSYTYKDFLSYFSDKINNPDAIRFFRIGVYAVLLFQSLVLCLPVADWIWGSTSFIRPSVLDGTSYDNSWVYRFFMALHKPQWENYYPYLMAIQCLSIFIGFTRKWTRLTAILIYLTTVLLFNRTYLLLTGGNYLIHLFLFFLMFVNENGKKSGVNAILTNAFFLACQFQVLTVYFFSSIFKLSGDNWQNGEALHYLFNMQEFSLPFLIGSFENYQPIFWLATYLSLAYQLLFPIFVWNKRLKKPLLLVGVLFHLLTIVIMGIPVFGFIMIVSYILFLNDSDIQSVRRFIPGRVKMIS